MIRIIPLSSVSDPLLSPDLVWDGTHADLVIDPATHDLRCRAALATAVLICLQTDRRVEPHEVPDGDSNRGWPGDAFDLQPGEVPLGSRLWLLRRRALTDGIEIEAQDHAREALQPLVDQGACVRVDVSAVRVPARNALYLDVALYGRDGACLYQQRYALLWEQVGNGF